MIKIVTVIAMLTVSISATICKPALLGENKFLESFITFELLNLLAVILTVTLASVANIHLSLNRIVRLAFKDKVLGAEKTNTVRKEISQDGWLLLWLFVIAICLLLAKGATDDVTVHSLVNSLGITVLLTNLIVLYDIYQVIYKLVLLEQRLPDNSTH